MGLLQMVAWGGSAAAAGDEAKVPINERCLATLVEGMALNVPEIDAARYKEMRINLSRLALQFPEKLPDEKKLELVHIVVHEFESYHASCENALRERLTAWHGLTRKLLHDLIKRLGIDAESAEPVALLEQLSHVKTAAEILAFRTDLAKYLETIAPSDIPDEEKELLVEDHSTANDNASGLMGGGSAVEYLKKVMAQHGSGFVVLFRLSCLDVIKQRFGIEAVHDCLMEVSAFLTASLHSDDAIFHWSDSSLIAILQGRGSEPILSAELRRIVAQNRDTKVEVGERTIMVRIPINFELTPIDKLRSADELFKLPQFSTSNW